MSIDARRSEALLLSEPGKGAPAGDGSAWPFGDPRRGSGPTRLYQWWAARQGRLTWEESIAAPLERARAEALGADAAGPPRVLIRVDEFPHARSFDDTGKFGHDAYMRFHEVLAEAGVPYLIAVSPRVSEDYLDPEVETDRPLSAGEERRLAELREDPLVTFALHGLHHRTRRASPRRRSEFCGLTPAAAAARIDQGIATLAELGVEVPVFVPPFNRFDHAQYGVLADRFEIVCSGPETIRLLGFQPTPSWWGDALYLPSYAPLYGKAAQTQPEVERLRDREAALWAPLTLHWGWELEDDFAGLRRLCALLGEQNLAADWRDLRDAAAEARRID
jgi:hypothetical protein